MLGTFLADPGDVPHVAVEYVAEQLGVADPSCIKNYPERLPTQHEHAREIRGLLGYREAADAGDKAEVRAFVASRAAPPGLAGWPRTLPLTSSPRLKPGDSSGHPLGFLFHSRLRTGCPVPSYISSTGIGTIGAYGKTCRTNVLRRVDVPVVPGTAGRARPVPRLQTQVRKQAPARRAGLAGGVPAVDHDQAPAVPGRLVLQLAAELTPARVMDRLVQPGLGCRPVRQVGAWPIRVRPGRGSAGHVADGQVFDHEHVMAADQPGAGAVQEISPGRADFPVRAGHLRLRLDAVRGPFLAAGQPPLIPGKSTSPAGQLPRIGDLLTVRGDGEVFDAQVHPGDIARRGGLPGPATSTAKDTCQRPHGSRETVTVAGLSVAGPMSGHDHTNASGAVVLASRSTPSRMENADRV